MADKPRISVVIATYNRSSVLQVTLERLAAQTIPPGDFEVLVVDDGSRDDTKPMVHSMAPVLPYSLRYFRHENRGPGYSENRGIKEARGDLVLLIADDIWADSVLLEQHLMTHRECPNENIAVLGKVLQSSELPKTVIHKYWDPFRYDRFDGARDLDGVFFFACNISVKKRFLLENGMFKERKGAAHEDVELGYRLSRKGLRIRYNEKAYAEHFHEESLGKACRRAYERGRNFSMLSENIPEKFIFPLYRMCFLEAGWPEFVKMLPREIPRRMAFNKWSIRFLWLPVLERAETVGWARVFAHSYFFRGTIHYHLRVGYRDWKREQRRQRSH